MSLIVDETPIFRSQKTLSTVIPSSERQLTKFGGKSRVLRLDSPTTIEACKELGVLVQDLKQKTLDDFKAENKDEEIMQLRFSHYMQRYTQVVKDVYAKKRELTRAKQRSEKAQHQQKQQQIQQQIQQHQQQQQQQNQQPQLFLTEANLVGYNLNVIPNSTRSNTQSMSKAGSLASPVFANYNKTLQYFRGSHNTAEVKDLYDIVGAEGSNYEEDDTSGYFDTALSQEISKFNKLKRQKQKEAKDAFEDEMKRVKAAEDQQDRERKRVDRHKKLAQEKIKNEIEKKKKAEEKLEKIRDMDRAFQERKMEQKEKMQQKLEETKRKLAEEAEEKRKQMLEHEERLEMKRKLAEEKREILKQNEQTRSDLLKMEVDQKLYWSQEKHDFILNEKSSRIKQQIQRIEDSTKRMKEKQVLDNKEYVQNLVEKLVKKEECIKTFQHQQLVQMKKREKEMLTKSQKFMTNQSTLQQREEDRMLEIEERFKKVEENIKLKKDEEDRNLMLKHELARLKMHDKHENYQRKIRQVQHERQKVLDKEKINQERLAWLRQQRAIIQQAKIESTIQSKIEKERIENAMQQLSKLTSEAKSSTTLTDQQKRLLKEILKPEDFKHLQDEEKRRKLEKLEAEELKKLGGSPDQIHKRS